MLAVGSNEGIDCPASGDPPSTGIVAEQAGGVLRGAVLSWSIQPQGLVMIEHRDRLSGPGHERRALGDKIASITPLEVA